MHQSGNLNLLPWTPRRSRRNGRTQLRLLFYMDDRRVRERERERESGWERGAYLRVTCRQMRHSHWNDVFVLQQLAFQCDVLRWRYLWVRKCVKRAQPANTHSGATKKRNISRTSLPINLHFWALKWVSKVLGKMCDSRTSYIGSVTISASANNLLTWLNYKYFIQCCHVWWMRIRIIARNDHQRALNQLRKMFAEALIVLFSIFYLWHCIACPMDDSHSGNIWCARITHLSKDFWDAL